MELTLEDKIAGIISPSLAQLGYELVRVKMTGSDGRKVLQVMLDRIDGAQVNVDDCEKASRQISATLDVEDPITDSYMLEVSSPGIDRPLTRLKDFENFKGLEAKLEVFEKIGEQRKFRGRLVGLEGNTVLLQLNVVNIDDTDNAELCRIEFNNIKSAKLVLSDELLAMHKSNNI